MWSVNNPLSGREPGAATAAPGPSRIAGEGGPGDPGAAAVPADATGASSSLLRTAAAWLGVLAIPGGLLGAVVVRVAFNPIFAARPEAGDQERALVIATSLVCAPLGAAVVAWRAASPGHRWASIVAFVLGAGTLSVFLVSIVAALMPTHDGFYGVDPYRVADAARLPWSVAVLVPASLMLAGTTLRWCVADRSRSRRRAWVACASLAVVVAPVGVLLTVAWWAPSCRPGWTCLPEAGITFAMPEGWSRVGADPDDFFAASAGSDRRRFVVEDGAGILVGYGHAVPSSVVELENVLPGLLAARPSISFTYNTDVAARREKLPAGDALRVDFLHWTSFLFALKQASITYWLRVGDRLLVFEYMEAYGEGASEPTSADPPELRRLLESVRPL